MRHLPKSYPYQKPSRNRSSKDLNQILGNASVFPAYVMWSNEQLAYFSSKCKNKKTNCYQETLDARVKARPVKAEMKAKKYANVEHKHKKRIIEKTVKPLAKETK